MIIDSKVRRLFIVKNTNNEMLKSEIRKVFDLEHIPIVILRISQTAE
jgi:hypothetical protein